MKKDYFVLVRSAYINGLKLKGCELLVFSVIASMDTDSSCCTCVPATLADMTGYSIKQVYRAIDSLVEKNLIYIGYPSWQLIMTNYAHSVIDCYSVSSFVRDSSNMAHCLDFYESRHHVSPKGQNVQDEGQNVQDD